MKRALMTFGNPFGLALYDKQQREVTSSASPLQQAQPSRPQLGNTDPEPSVELGLEPLDPATIQTILSTVRGLPKPAQDGFTKAFRKRFQVPADAPIDRI